MTFSDLHTEYLESLIGDRIYGIVRELAAQIAWKYPEAVYNDGLKWDSQSFEDLCQEVVLNQLLNQNQIHYIFSEASEAKSVESVRRLLTKQVKRALIARRKKSPIDRLTKRVLLLAEDGAIEKRRVGAATVFVAVGSDAASRPLEKTQIDICVREASSIPRLESRLDSSRESMIYTKDHLIELVLGILGSVKAVSEADLREIFESLLTPWVPATLIPIEWEFPASSSSAEDLVEEQLMIDTARSLAESFSNDEVRVLVLKSLNIADAQIAAEIGRSRPTVADMKNAVLARVRQELMIDIPSDNHELAMQHLLNFCNQLLEEESG